MQTALQNLRMALAAILLCALLVGCTPQQDVTTDWAEMPTEHRPALWKVSRNGQHGYMFGSIHALPHKLNWVGPKIMDALDDSKTMVLEIDPSQEIEPIPDTFRAMGASTNIPPVKQRISATLQDEYAVLEKAGNLQDSAFKGRESWAAALSLAGIATSGLGVRQDYGVEAVMSAQALKRKMPIVALETAAEQFGYFDRLPEAEQTRMLEAVIADAANAKTNYRSLLANWLTGDIAALAKTAQTGVLATGPVRDALLIQRNADWAAPIADYIDSGKRPFVAVGAAHVAGEDSVQAMLVAQGFTVERIQ